MIKTEALNFKKTYTTKANFITEIGFYLNENYENTYNSYKNATDYILTRIYFYYYNYYLNAGTKEDFERLFTFTLTSKLDYFNALLNVYNSSINPREKEKRINNSSDSVVHTSKGEQTNATSPENYNDFDTDSYITNKNKHDNKTTDNVNHEFTSYILQSLGMTLKDIALIPMKLNEEIVRTFAKLFIGESGEEKSYPLIYQNLTNVYYKLLDYVKKLPDSEELQREIDVINSSLSGITDSLNDIDNRLNTNETSISSLETSISNIKSNLDLTNTNLSSLEIKLKEEVTRALNKEEIITSDIETIRSEIETLTTNLENIEKALSNYATLSYLNEEYYNKATIDTKENTLKTSIETNTSSINTLNASASTTGSVDYKVKMAIDDIIDNAPETYDTFKEVADYIASDTTATASMLASIQKNTQAIEDAKTSIPTRTSQLTNDSGFLTSGDISVDLTDYYNKTQIDNFISSLNTSISEVTTKVDTNTSKITEVEETSTNALTLALTTSTSLHSEYYTKTEIDNMLKNNTSPKLYFHYLNVVGRTGTTTFKGTCVAINNSSTPLNTSKLLFGSCPTPISVLEETGSASLYENYTFSDTTKFPFTVDTISLTYFSSQVSHPLTYSITDNVYNIFTGDKVS